MEAHFLSDEDSSYKKLCLEFLEAERAKMNDRICGFNIATQLMTVIFSWNHCPDLRLVLL